MVIETSELTRSFGDVRALDGVSIAVPRGGILGLLGHNGAGKTTLVNILTTQLPPTGGTARVVGHDVATQGRAVRSRIGLSGQFASVDERLSGMENLVLIARLFGAGRREARARAVELLEMFGLSAAAHRRARTYSGGMRRRLDLAAGIVSRPDVVFLDEPTTGLDPESRVALWDIVRELATEGTAVLLTTQYLEEADRLADTVTVLASGRVVASGTAAELKSRYGERAVHLTLADPWDAERAAVALRRAGLHPSRGGPTSLNTPVDAATDLVAVSRAVAEAGVEPTSLSLTEPSLDDVYLALRHPTDLAGAGSVR